MKGKLLFFALLFSVYIEGFSMAKKPKLDCIIGEIAYFGNDPFVSMVIRTNDKKVYSVKAQEEIIDALKNEFGKRIEFYGTIISVNEGVVSSVAKDGVFELEYFKVLEK